jgi:hypothetical protein
MGRSSRRCHSRRTLGVLAISLLASFCTAPNSFAQILYASLTGTITDPAGGPVPQAKVEALNVKTALTRDAVTDDRGMYLFTHLEPGTYKITISGPSFGTVTEQVQLDANTEQRVDAQLPLAQVRQTVTVNAPNVTLQTERADVNTQIESGEIANLPLGTDRNFQSLYKLVPGSSPPVAAHSPASNPTGSLAMNINGQSDTSNSTLIDGMLDPNFWELDLIAYVPPAEAIQSLNIVTGGFDAEQGNAGGSVTNLLIKSGTNELHGAAWEYNTVSALQARNFFYYGTTNPKNILNQFGLELGGPIVKSKLFFFVDWERYLLRQTVSGLFSVPTQATRSGNFSGTNTSIYNPNTGNTNGTGRQVFGNQIPASLLSPAAVKMTALIPLPNTGSGVANNYFGTGNLRFNRDNVDLKISYNPTERSTLFGRYSAEPTFIFDPQELGAAGGPAYGASGQPGNASGLSQNASLGGTYTFTPNVLLDGNVGFVRQALSAENTDLNKNYGSDVLGIPGTNGPSPLQGGYPFFAISGLTSLGNPYSYNPFEFWDNEYLVAGNLSWVKGSHSFRFGVNFNRYQLNHWQPFAGGYGPRGGFNFTGGLTALNGGKAPNVYNAWAEFLLGLPTSMGKDYQYMDPETLRENEYAVYARDQWQVTHKLNIDYGIRYEFYPFPTRDHFGGSNYDPATNLAYLGGVNGVPSNAYVNVGAGQLNPRFGFAYQLDKRTVVRGGFGINSDPYPFTYMLDIYPATISQQFNGANSYSAAGSLSTGLPPINGPDLSLGKFPLPATVGTRAFPQDFRRGYTEAYNLTLQRDMGAGINAQAAYVGTHTVRANAFDDINSAGPGSGSQGTPFYQLWGNANAINLLAPFNGGSYDALQTKATRRMAGGGVITALYTFSKAIDYVDEENTSLMWSWAPAWGRNKALAGYDRTHNFQLFAVYELPFGKGKRWLTQGLGSTILGDWTFSPILSYMSGTPLTVTSSGASVNAPGNTQTADQVISDVTILGGHGPGEPYFDPNAFAPVTAVRFGTSGRDILRGPGLFNLDASLVREFTIKEFVKLEFRADAFGLTNTPQFSNPGTNVSNATFVGGTVTNYNGYDIISSASGQRQIRFALKLSF